MGRPALYDKQYVLDAATELFRACGYEISMRDIFKATSMSPNSLYAEFSNKEGLFLSALDNYRANVDANCMYILYEAPKSMKNIKRFLLSYIENTDEFGCLMMNSLTHRESIPTNCGKKIDQFYFEMGEAILNCLKSDEQMGNYEVKKLKYYTMFLIGVLQGAIISLRQGVPLKIIEQQIDIAMTAKP